MAVWIYSDWITLSDRAERLTRLRLHIQEVSERLFSTASRSKSVSAVQEGYLDRLSKAEAELAIAVARGASGGVGRNKVHFRNP